MEKAQRNMFKRMFGMIPANRVEELTLALASAQAVMAAAIAQSIGYNFGVTPSDVVIAVTILQEAVDELNKLEVDAKDLSVQGLSLAQLAVRYSEAHFHEITVVNHG